MNFEDFLLVVSVCGLYLFLLQIGYFSIAIIISGLAFSVFLGSFLFYPKKEVKEK